MVDAQVWCCLSDCDTSFSVLSDGLSVHKMPLDHFFFFSSRRRHTRLQGDWSSDVCSSDLEGIELTSDFTAQVNADMSVGAIQDTVTVTEEVPVVDTQNITTRTVMTRDILDVMPTGRNIQAVGIMIPGTTIRAGGGGAISRDVGGSGGLQQSPLVYKGSDDAVQTVEGLRLNNLCGNGAFSGVYWNDGSFQEISYVTGADSAEMGQGGVRIAMVPKDGSNSFHGTVFGSFTRGP